MHSGGNDRFCARLKMDISAFSSGLQGHLRSCLTILDSSRRPLSKNVRHDLVRPQRPELEAEMSVFNLAQKRSFPPLCNVIIIHNCWTKTLFQGGGVLEGASGGKLAEDGVKIVQIHSLTKKPAKIYELDLYNFDTI
jgi:hypothetical protein